MKHQRKGHFRQSPKGPVFVQAATVGENTPEEQQRLAEITARARKKKHSDAGKKAWETIRRKKKEADEAKASKKKFRSIDDEGVYG